MEGGTCPKIGSADPVESGDGTALASIAGTSNGGEGEWGPPIRLNPAMARGWYGDGKHRRCVQRGGRRAIEVS
jgi:hypothetical protein